MLLLASGIEQTWNCLIVGRQPGAAIVAEHVRAENFSCCRYVIQAFDSTEWSIGAASEATGAQARAATAY